MEGKRPKELGYLFVVGGPGGSGSTTISKLLAKQYNLNHLYGGQIMREIAKEKGYANIADFLATVTESNNEEYDNLVDKKLVKRAYTANALIESKIFAALSKKYRIPTTVCIWLDASVAVRAKRKGCSEEELIRRYENDKKRYKDIYGIDYDKPKQYNDIVLDISNMNEYQTLNLIIKLIEDGGYTK